MRSVSGAPGSANPPASSAGVKARGSSRSARGFPRVSAMIVSRTRSSRGPGIAESSNTPASSSPTPSRTSSGSPLSASMGSRVTNTSASGSASSRRATNASARADASSNHWASSSAQSNGRSSATSDSRLSAASPTRKRSGASPPLSPNATRSASCCGAGRRSSRSSIGAHRC